MNEFIEQFLLEARELVGQATDDLLALEGKPDDRDRLDSVFRAFHTLKGAAGIVDFAAMARAVHAAEDVLAAVRAGADPVTPRLVGDCLTCLDQVVQWLDGMQAEGRPPADAEASAEAVVRRFAATSGPSVPLQAPSEGRIAASGWAEALLARHPAAAAEATIALRYAPDSSCFFRGEDPLALIAGLPGILALEFAPVSPWPELNELDPFACNLTFLALASGTAETIEALLLPVRGQVEIRRLRTAPAAAEAGPIASPQARALLEAQLLLLREGGADGDAGRLASAGRVAANVLRHGRRVEQADRLERVLAESQAAGDPQLLAAAIRHALGTSPEAGSDEEYGAARVPQDVAARTLRVDVERIDALVNFTGELIVAKNAVGHTARSAQDGADPKSLAATLKDQAALLDRLVGELQRSVLGIRVLPVRHVFRHFPRLVREMAAKLGKPARLVTEGEDTEADKAVVEALFEPLLHVLRNAVDHGIESAQERAALGKPPVATLRLRAAREGEHVLVEAEDDGRGIDVARIRHVAAERRTASADRLAAMTDDEIVSLIFTPGFSTAAEITGLSGRGVGMDAVRAAVERLGGRVVVESRPGRGTTIGFTLPFTLMMTRVMTVEAGGQTFAIPLDVVMETVRVARERIVPVGAARAFVLRDRTVPLIGLAQALGRTPDEARSGEANIVVASAAGQLVGVEVERLGERMDVMLKPMDGLLAGIPGIAGTTLLGDGRVLVVLDVQELVR